MTVILTGMTYAVGPKGQVVIPKEYRDALGIRSGQEMSFELRDDGLLLRPAADRGSSVRALRGTFASAPLDAAALLAERRADREREERGLGA